MPDNLIVPTPSAYAYPPDVLLRLKRDEKVTFSHCVPTILRMLLQGATTSGQDLSGWKIIIDGSALSPSTGCRRPSLA